MCMRAAHAAASPAATAIPNTARERAEPFRNRAERKLSTISLLRYFERDAHARILGGRDEMSTFVLCADQGFAGCCGSAHGDSCGMGLSEACLPVRQGRNIAVRPRSPFLNLRDFMPARCEPRQQDSSLMGQEIPVWAARLSQLIRHSFWRKRT